MQKMEDTKQINTAGSAKKTQSCESTLDLDGMQDKVLVPCQRIILSPLYCPRFQHSPIRQVQINDSLLYK